MTTIKLFNLETGVVSEEDPPAKNALVWLYKKSFINKALCCCLANAPFLAWGYALFQNSSFSRKSIPPLIDRYKVDMTQFQGSIDTFRSFSDFFERRLAKGARPLSSGFVSPADGRLKILQNPTKFEIKGRSFSLEKLVKDPEIAARFSDGHLLTVRLAPEDYHRLHAPMDGVVKKVVKIGGPLYSVSPIALKENLSILSENKRVLIDFGSFALVLVGATFVGTIHIDVAQGSTVKKGEEIAHFSFGGSMCVVLLKKGFELAKGLEFPDGEVLIKMGQTIGNQIAHLNGH